MSDHARWTHVVTFVQGVTRMHDDLTHQLADHAAQIAALKRDLEAVKEMLERLIAKLRRGEP